MQFAVPIMFTAALKAPSVTLNIGGAPHSQQQVLEVSQHKNELENVICPGGVFQCPDKFTCCPVSGGYGCCPLQGATCCKDGKHCCPKGYKCLGLNTCAVDEE
ncbi:unnamed protein product [Darwinula stevensoni]|uniref:Granulins domain-containing protein n=1 Tax=Darwinula stevensoni TaxID=69355 RepID=A0A7R8X6T7_9CRUS|nr:unnamed protein product [Darwinula stevensoni]CAG0882456.1 unnamed protein product [Darwinula stevensoni]